MRRELDSLLKNGRTIEQIENSARYKAYISDGWRGWLKWQIEELRKDPGGYNASFNLSAKYALIGDRENALYWMEKAFNEHLFMLPYANVLPEFDDLRDDARFQNIMLRVGLQ